MVYILDVDASIFQEGKQAMETASFAMNMGAAWFGSISSEI
jgi:hypothetical protein